MVDERRRVLVCPRCGSHERHRALWLYLRDTLGEGLSVLHWAPERALEQRLRERPGIDYTTADLEPGKATRVMDITAIDAPEASWDVIVCSHVLEHIPDDRRAIAELARVLKPGGEAVVMVPLDRDREATLEDPSIDTPEQRWEAYWSGDHVRLYGRDFPRRLEEAGLQVRTERPAAHLDEPALARLGLDRQEELYICRKPGPDVETLRRAYAAFDLQRAAAGELDAVFEEMIDPEFELRLPAHYPDLEGARGIEAIKGMLRTIDEVWDEWRLVPERYVEGDGGVVVLVTLISRGQESGAELVTRGAHLWALRKGKLLRNTVFLDRDEALTALTEA